MDFRFQRRQVHGQRARSTGRVVFHGRDETKRNHEKKYHARFAPSLIDWNSNPNKKNCGKVISFFFRRKEKRFVFRLDDRTCNPSFLFPSPVFVSATEERKPIKQISLFRYRRESFHFKVLRSKNELAVFISSLYIMSASSKALLSIWDEQSALPWINQGGIWWRHPAIIRRAPEPAGAQRALRHIQRNPIDSACTPA